MVHGRRSTATWKAVAGFDCSSRKVATRLEGSNRSLSIGRMTPAAASLPNSPPFSFVLMAISATFARGALRRDRQSAYRGLRRQTRHVGRAHAFALHP